MKKISLILGITIAASQFANARVNIRTEAGVSFSKINFKFDGALAGANPTTAMRVAPKAGINFMVPIIKGLYIEPGVYYTGVNFQSEYTLAGLTSNKTKGTMHAIQVPVNIGYSFNAGPGQIFASVGPYVGYSLAGKLENTTTVLGLPTTVNRNIELGTDATDDFKPLDLGLNAGAGYQLDMGVYFRVNYGMGLTNISPKSNTDNKTTAISLTVGYSF